MEEVSQEDIRMGYPQVEVVVALAVNDLPARIAVGMSGKGVNLHRDVLCPEELQKPLHIGNAAEILPPNGKEGGHIGEVLPGQLRSQVPCAIDAQECVFCARQPVIFIRNIVREILINRLVVGMNAAAASMERTLSGSTNTLQTTLKGFNGTVESFNQGVRDFSEFDYNLRGTVERLDVAVRDLSNALRKAGQALERSDRG